tara:strand:- start:2825 stop:3244 length:420 start_codon:yes stop_codon:yes gene_type:complete
MKKNKLTIKQENFCTKYVECGNGSEAYRFAYDVGKDTKICTINNKAYELLKRGDIGMRVQELKDKVLKKHEVTTDSLLKELEQARALAEENNHTNVMVSATMGKAKLTGLEVNKQEIEVKGVRFNMNYGVKGDEEKDGG